MNLASVSKFVIRQILGIAIAAASLYTGWLALHEHPIAVDLVKFAGVGLLLGGLVIDPDPIFAALKQLLSLLPVALIARLGGTAAPADLAEAQKAAESHGD